MTGDRLGGGLGFGANVGFITGLLAVVVGGGGGGEGLLRAAIFCGEK